MSTVYLIRHGQASFAEENYDQLSELGYQQARILGESFRQRGVIPNKVVLGSMVRHRQTADHCLGEYSDAAEYLIDDKWNEYDHENILQCWAKEQNKGQSIAQFIEQQDQPQAAFEQFFNDAIRAWMQAGSDARYVESWADFKQRTRLALDQLCDNLPRNEIAFVFTSGGPIARLCQSLLGVAEEKLMTMNWTLVNAGYSKIVVTGKRRFLSSLNVHAHFDEMGREYITYR